jgi:hypothetical protein
MRLVLAACVVVLASCARMSGGDDRQAEEQLPVKIRGEQKAPEFADIAEWINSEPLKMADLRGKVVVVHFMTFG